MVINSENGIMNKKGLGIDEKNRLTFDGCQLEVLASEYGTPSYIFSENIIRNQCREYINTFQDSGIDFEVLYAGRPFWFKPWPVF